MNKPSYFVSDLHLFCNRSIADRHVSAFRLAASKAETFILGGDIFDFKWSQFGSVEKTLIAARKWIEDFIHPHPDCQFHYLLGNHDCSPEFIEQLQQVTDSTNNFQWHPYYLRLESAIFLHGDVIDCGSTQKGLEVSRSDWSLEKPLGRAMNAFYDSAVALRLHRIAAQRLNRPEQVAQKLLHYLSDIDHGQPSGISDVYFGHTHCHLDRYEYSDIRFHNAGAPIKWLPFRMIEMTT